MFNDSKLQHAVLAELAWEQSIDAGRVGVTADEGIVTLTGHVASFAQKHAAETAAHRVKGVRAVVDAIEVRLSTDSVRGDAEIAADAISRLARDVSIPLDAITVTVDRGWVTLTGEVDSYFRKQAAEENVRRLFGVIGISNQVNIKPKVDVVNLSDDIMHAMHRSWFFDPQTIAVTADGGRVRLTGTVRSPHDRQLAAATAWGSPGTTDVENEIAVI